MKSPKPPALATWLAGQLQFGDKNEALVGDLLEEFQLRHSVTWYWRQVLLAILASLSNKLRAHWVTLTAQCVFAAIWTRYALFYALPFFRHRFWVMAFEPHTRIAWWILLHLGVPLSLVPLPLIIYLVTTRKFGRRPLVYGVCAGVLTFVVLLRMLPSPYTVANFFLPHGLAAGSVIIMDLDRWYYLGASCVPLLVAVWAAPLGKKRSRANTIPS